jgi:Delta7-sterol 5-desaturase
MDIIKQMLPTISQGLISGIFVNGTIITLVYFIVWKKYKTRLRNWRIQLKERVDNEQIKRELKNSAFTLFVSVCFSSVVFYLNSLGYTKIYTNIDEHSRFFAFGGFFVIMLVDDTWFYWMHRLLHHPKLFRFIHFEHHKSIDVNPFTSMSFHVLETVLLTFWILPFSFVFPLYAPSLIFVQIWGFLDNLKAHVGYEFYPSWWNKSVFRFFTTSTHHNMHHSKFNGNYGVHFRIWDKLLGTEFKDYETEYDKIQLRKKLNPQLEEISNQ